MNFYYLKWEKGDQYKQCNRESQSVALQKLDAHKIGCK